MAAGPLRIASLDLCSDELVMALADRARIVSVSYLSHDPEETPFWRVARPYPTNDGSLLSVIRHRPDMVVTMGGGGRDRERIASRLGVRLVTLPFAAGASGLRQSILQLGLALNRPGVTRRWIEALDALERSRPRGLADAVWLGNAGQTPSADGPEAQWLALAGLHQRPVSGARVSLEELLLHPPSVVIRSRYRAGQFSRGRQYLSHPLIRRLSRGREVSIDGRAWTCMGPPMISEIRRLRAVVQR